MVIQRKRWFFLNIDGATIDTALEINFGSKLYPLNYGQRGIWQNMLVEVNFIIRDKTFTVSNMFLYQMYQSLCKIFGYSTKVTIVGLPAPVFGDLYQLCLVKVDRIQDGTGNI